MTSAEHPIQIAHVIVGLDVGGAERFLHRLVASHDGNTRFQHRVISLTSSGELGPRLQSLGVRVDALGMRSLHDAPRTYARLKRNLRGSRPDVLQCWMYYADLLGGLAGRRLGIRPILWGIRNSHFESGGTRLKKAVRRTCAMTSRFLPWRIICVADAALKVHAEAGYDRSRMEVIPNGYDLNAFTYSAADRLRLRRELRIRQDEIVVGSVGRYSAAKNHRGFIEAAHLAAGRHPNLRFVLVGRDLMQENAELMQCIQNGDHPERFVLLGERSDVAQCLSAMDLFCLHSLTEGFPNVLGEAMSVGLPCLTTDVGDARVLLGDTGRVVPPADVEALTRAMLDLAELEPTQRRQMGARSRQRIAERFTLERSVSRFEDLYRTAASLPR